MFSLLYYKDNMFVRVKERSNGKKSIQIVESVRREDKVNQQIIRHVGQAVTDREVEELTKLARSIIEELKSSITKQQMLPIFSPESIFKAKESKKTVSDASQTKNLREEQRIIDGIGDVFGKVYSDLGLDNILVNTKRNEQWNSILKACVIARIANPDSKRGTAAFLERDYAIRIQLDKIYRMMDHVFKNEKKIKSQICLNTLSLFDEEVNVLFFDVTTLYFESFEADGLRETGYSKDNKFKETQVVLALVTTQEGLPITFKTFPGNTYEGHTLIDIIKELKNEYRVKNVLLVADRAMFNDDNLTAMELLGVNYIVAAKLKTLPKLLKKEILENDDFKAQVVENELHWINEYEHKGRRLIVGYSTKRASKDAYDRQKLIDRLLKKVKGGKIKIKEIIPNYGSKKYLDVENNTAQVNENKILDDSKWDGLHGVISNSDIEATDILSKYRGLWQIEAAFRVSKHDLEMRPIFHWNPERIKAHILICYIAYSLVKQVVHRVKLQQTELSFEIIREELLRVQSSLYSDLLTKEKIIIPSKVTPIQKKIYQVFGLRRSNIPYSL
jgi:transposase